MSNETIQTSIPGDVSPELPMATTLPVAEGEPVAPAEPHSPDTAVDVTGEDSPGKVSVADTAVESLQAAAETNTAPDASDAAVDVSGKVPSETAPVVETAVEGGPPVAETNAPPPLPPPSSPPTGMNWTWPIVALVAVAAVVWLGKKLKANTAAFEKSAEDELVDSILDVVAKEAPDRAALRQELVAVVANGGTLRTGPLATILRIEDGYEKKSPGRYLRRISVLRRKEGTTGSLSKIECELGWEYIPEAVREQFIKTRQAKVVRLVYDAKGEGI